MQFSGNHRILQTQINFPDILFQNNTKENKYILIYIYKIYIAMKYSIIKFKYCGFNYSTVSLWCKITKLQKKGVFIFLAEVIL